jgi:hypothetical protein
MPSCEPLRTEHREDRLTISISPQWKIDYRRAAARPPLPARCYGRWTAGPARMAASCAAHARPPTPPRCTVRAPVRAADRQSSPAGARNATGRRRAAAPPRRQLPKIDYRLCVGLSPTQAAARLGRGARGRARRLTQRGPAGAAARRRARARALPEIANLPPSTRSGSAARG